MLEHKRYASPHANRQPTEDPVHELKLLTTHDEAGDIRSFVFDTAGLQWQAGQHSAFTLKQVGDDAAANKRYFTIASAPGEGHVRITTRISNTAFKQALTHLRVGDTIEAAQINGRFTWAEESAAPALLVAGGIGITPYRAILFDREARGLKLNATLLYFSRDDAIAFRGELDALAARHAEFSVHYLIGTLATLENLDAHTPVGVGTAFLSGPKVMVDNLGNALKARGQSVKQDWFPGYDETNY